MSNATLDNEGPGGNTAVHINGSDNSFVSFGTQIGQFGTSDFTLAFWLQTKESYRYFDIAGNRAAGSHGNFFCIRMTGKHESRPGGIIASEVDQDQNGTNYIGVESKTAGFNDGKWHHLAVVRQGKSLKLYIDGVILGNATGNGVANIANGQAFKLGRSLVGVDNKFAPDARYSGLRVYDTALNDSEISSLFSTATATKLPTNSKIKLKSWKGDYLHRPDTAQGVTTWNTGIGNEWIVESIGDNKIKLKSWKGDYLHRPDTAQGVTTWNTGIGNEWIVESIGDNKIKLKSWKGDYLHRPDTAQGVTTWNTGIGNEWIVELISTVEQTVVNTKNILVGIGMNNQLFTRKTLTSNWEYIPNSGSVLGITVMADGTIVGIGMNNQLFTRKTLTSNWEHIPNSGSVLGITVMADGTIVGIGMNNQLYTRKTLTSNWQHIPNSGSVLGITVMADGTIVGIGMNNQLFTRKTLTSNWEYIPNSGSVLGITVMADGTIVGIGMNNQLFTRKTLTSNWEYIPNSGSVLGVASAQESSTVTNPPAPKSTVVNTKNILVGIGMNNQLFTRKTLTSNWEYIPNSGSVLGITVMADGTIVGIGMNNQLFTRKTLTSNWEHIPNSGSVLGITVMADGTIVGIGMNNQLFTRKTLTSNWEYIPNSGSVLGITVMADGTIVGIGMNNQLFTRKTLTSNWEYIPNSGSVLGITVMADGTIVGIGMNNQLFTRKTLTSNWEYIPNSGSVLGVASAQESSTVTNPPAPKSLNGQIVINADEWTLSDQGIKAAPDGATFALNVAKYFVGDNKGKFHVLSNNFGLTGASLANTMANAGHTWTKGINITVNLTTLQQYDGIFIGGDPVDNQVLIEYVKNGGKVYLCAGTGQGGAQVEANNWNTFLAAFGLQYQGIYNGISANVPVNNPNHPLFTGVKTLYQNNGNSITDLQPNSPLNHIILAHSSGQGLIATAEFIKPSAESVAEVTPEPSAESVAEVTPEPSAESVAEVTPEPSAESVAEVTPEPSAESVAEVTPEPSAESVAEVTPEPSPESVAETLVSDAEEFTITVTKDVTISRLVYKGEVKRTQADEYIEISNLGNSTADISGWKITSAGSAKQVFTFPQGTILEGGKNFRVYTNQEHSETGGFSFGSKTAIWNDAGDEAKLFDAEGSNVSTLAYGKNTIGGIKKELKVPQLQFIATHAAINKQMSLGGKVTFTQALSSAIKSFIEDDSDVNSPLAQILNQPHAFGFADGVTQAIAGEKVRSLLNEGGVLSLYPTAENTAPANGETVDKYWIFALSLGLMGETTFWAIVPRSGEQVLG
ncbi:tectonin domain-containing protein [Nodularia spumigena]|uniref:tectonin domain-containing protein n=2 Tax=Nodularia spumigena TaxID=70799 RepID=UPI001E5EB32C|nr:tectonin domain-containing protein [Nodularia spumigena]